MKEVIEYLKERVTEMNKSEIPMDYAVVIDGVEAQKIIDFYEHHKGESERSNAPDITPEWDKIPEGFIFVAIDKNGEEYAYSGEPFHDHRQWRANGQWNKTGRKFDMTNIDWAKSLSKRPAK